MSDDIEQLERRGWTALSGPGGAALDDVRVVEAGDTAAIPYHATAERPSQEHPYRARMSSVYVRRDGQWRLILHQQSPDPA